MRSERRNSAGRRVGRDLGEAGVPAALGLFRERPRETLAPGRALFWEGDPAGDVFLVERGELRLQRIVLDGRRAVAAFLQTGDLVGTSFGATCPMTAEAVTDVCARRMPRAVLMARAVSSEALSAEICRQMRVEIDGTIERIITCLHRSADERVAGFLVDRARRDAAGLRAGAEIRLPMARADIADHLGLTVETVSRCFTKFKSEGLLVLPDPARAIVMDARALQARAGEDLDAYEPPDMPFRNASRIRLFASEQRTGDASWPTRSGIAPI